MLADQIILVIEALYRFPRKKTHGSIFWQIKRNFGILKKSKLKNFKIPILIMATLLKILIHQKAQNCLKLLKALFMGEKRLWEGWKLIVCAIFENEKSSFTYCTLSRNPPRRYCKRIPSSKFTLCIKSNIYNFSKPCFTET